MRMGVLRLLSVFTAVAVMGVGLPVIVAQPAQADIVDHCYGHRVAKHRLRLPSAEGLKMGRVELWYDSRSGGTSCVMTYNGHKGKQFTVAALKVGKRKWRRDSGHYRYYAGGVRAKHTNGKCVKFGGQADRSVWSYVYLSKRRHPRTGKPC